MTGISASLFTSHARGEVILTDQYWDCECEAGYIHPRTDDACKVCQAQRDDQPDSRVKEVLDQGLPLMPDFVLELLQSTSDGKTAEVIAIKLNETGYYPTTWGRQTGEWVADMNARLGIDPTTQLTYSMCSVMGNWSNYANVFKHIKEALDKKMEAGNE